MNFKLPDSMAGLRDLKSCSLATEIEMLTPRSLSKQTLNSSVLNENHLMNVLFCYLFLITQFP